MKRRWPLGVAAIVIVIAAVAIITWRRVHDSSSAITAAQVVQRSEAAAKSFADQITAGTTLHTVRFEYYPDTPPSGSFVNPVHTQIDEYIAFGANGQLVALRTIESDDDTDQIFATTELVDGVLVNTDVRTGETRRTPFNSTTNAAANLASNLRSAAVGSAPAVGGTKAPRMATVEGIRSYVIEDDDDAGQVVRRYYYDASTYRQVKSETVGPDGSVSRSDETVVFEILPGEVLPTPAPVVATTIAAAHTVAAERPSPTATP